MHDFEQQKHDVCYILELYPSWIAINLKGFLQGENKFWSNGRNQTKRKQEEPQKHLSFSLPYSQLINYRPRLQAGIQRTQKGQALL